MERKPLIYVAGPITKPDPYRNAVHACGVAQAVQAAGAVPIVPHLSVFWIRETGCDPWGYEGWMDIDFQMILRCDAIYRIPGESSGADREEVFAAEHGIPVLHSYKELEHFIDNVYDGDTQASLAQ